MKKTLLFIMAVLLSVGAQARLSERILWTPATASDIAVNVYENSSIRFVAGDVIRIYVTVPNGKTGVSCHLRYSKNGTDFSVLADNEWPWIASGSTYGSVTLTEAHITALTTSGNGTYLYFGYNSGTANINKITKYSGETETTLWEATQLGTDIVNSFVVGDVIRVYCTVPTGGASFKIVYKGNGGDWTEKFLSAANNGYPWINYEDTYIDLALTEDDIKKIKDNYLYVGAFNMKSIDKISLLTETAASTTDLWTGTAALEKSGENWGSISESVLTPTNTSGAKVNDIIRITYESANADNVISLRNREGWGNLVNNSDEDQATKYNISTTATYTDFEINCARMLEVIQEKGFIVTGYGMTVTKIQLISYSDSYDAAYVEIGSDGIATYSHIKNLDFSETGITPYYASEVSNGSVTLTSIDNKTTYQYTGYILKGSAGKYDVPIATNPTYLAKDYLKATNIYNISVAASVDGTFHYVFAKNSSGVVGFYKLTSDHTLAAHKAYLETATDIKPTSGSRIALNFDDGETTYIDALPMNNEKRMENIGYYNLAGQRVAQPTKGLYIVNGKKVIIK